MTTCIYTPPMVSYKDAISHRGDTMTTRYGLRESVERFHSGTYRIGDQMLLDVAVGVGQVPDFCGGHIVNSPCVKVVNLAFGNLGSENSRAGGDDYDGMLDLRERVDLDLSKSDVAVKYGFTILANAVVSIGLKSGKLGFVMAGTAEGGSSMSLFQDALRSLAWVRPVDGVWNKDVPRERCDPHISDKKAAFPVTVGVHEGKMYRNYNSGNNVSFNTAVIDCESYHDCQEEYDYDKDDYFWVIPESAMDAPILDEERVHILNQWKWIRRNVWRNG